MLKKGARSVNSQHLEIRIGNPIYPASYLKDNKNRLASAVKEQVSKLLNEQ